jgi:hypothetical protein
VFVAKHAAEHWCSAFVVFATDIACEAHLTLDSCGILLFLAALNELHKLLAITTASSHIGCFNHAAAALISAAAAPFAWKFVSAIASHSHGSHYA